MKICFVDLFLDLECSGGSMHSLDLYATKLAEGGHGVSVLTLHPKRNIGFERSSKRYRLIEENLNIENAFELINGLARILQKNEGFDVYHVHDPRLLLGAAMYRKGGGKTPVVGDLNTYLFRMRNLGGGFLSFPAGIFHGYRLRTINDHVDMLIPVSPYVEKVYSEHGVSGKKMTMVPDGFDFGSLKAKKIPKKGDKFRILYVGRLERTKGVDVTIKALGRLGDVPLEFHVAGDGPERKNLEMLVKQKGVSEKVKFHGFVSFEKMLELYASSDVFIHAARWEEPFGRAVVEAMSFGLPVIVADIGAPPWVAYGACLTFTPEKDAELADRIGQVYSDKGLRKKLSESGLDRAKYFDVGNTIRKFVNVYKILTRK